MFSPINSYQDREREAYVSRVAGEHGVAPKVYYVDPKLEGIIIEFLPGRTMLKNDLERSEDIIAFAQFLRKVHEIPMEKYEATSPLKRGDEWLLMAKERDKSLPSLFDAVSKKIEQVKKVLTHMPTKKVFIHNDLMPPNIMISGSSFKLIDWPEAGTGNPFWDLTAFCDWNNCTDAERKIFLEGYFGRVLTEKEQALFTIMRPVSTFIRAVGGFTFEQESYSTEFYDQHLRNGLPHFTKMVEDFSLGQLVLPLWQVALICFAETVRMINDPSFGEALNRLNSLDAH